MIGSLGVQFLSIRQSEEVGPLLQLRWLAMAALGVLRVERLG